MQGPDTSVKAALLGIILWVQLIVGFVVTDGALGLFLGLFMTALWNNDLSFL